MELIHEVGSWGDEILAAQKKKWEVDSISRLQDHSGLVVS